MEGRPFASAVDLIACASALGVLGIAFTGFRIYSKLVIFGRLKLDDWLAIVGVVLFVFHSICVGYCKEDLESEEDIDLLWDSIKIWRRFPHRDCFSRRLSCLHDFPGMSSEATIAHQRD